MAVKKRAVKALMKRLTDMQKDLLYFSECVLKGEVTPHALKVLCKSYRKEAKKIKSILDNR